MKSLNEIFGETKQSNTQVKQSAPIQGKRPLSDIFNEQPASTVKAPIVSEYKPAPAQNIAPTIQQEQPKKSLFNRVLSTVFQPVTSGKIFSFTKEQEDVLNKKIVQPVFDKTLNTEKGKKFATTLAKDTGMSIFASIPATTKFWGNILSGEKGNFKEEYEQVKQEWQNADADTQNSALENFARTAGNATTQSLIGTALRFVPVVGKPLSYGYYGTLSASEQIQKKGTVDNFGNILVDTVGDSFLGGVVENILKKPAQALVKSGFSQTIKNLGQGYLVEGITEPSQSLLKYANDYRVAKTQEEKDKIKQETIDYVKNGGMLMEFLVGGISGALITGGASAIQGNLGSGDVNIAKPKLGILPEDDKEYTDEQNKVREGFRDDVLDALKENSGNVQTTADEVSENTGIRPDVAEIFVSEIKDNIYNEEVSGGVDVVKIGEDALNEVRMLTEAPLQEEVQIDTEQMENNILEALGREKQDTTYEMPVVEEPKAEIVKEPKQKVTKEPKITEFVSKKREEGFSDFEIARELQTEQKISINEAIKLVEGVLKQQNKEEVKAEIKPLENETTPNAVAPRGATDASIRVGKNGDTTIKGIEITPENTKVTYKVIDDIGSGKQPISTIKKALIEKGVSKTDIDSILSRVPQIDGQTYTDNVFDAITDHNDMVKSKKEEVFPKEKFKDYTDEENTRVAEVSNEYWEKVTLPAIENGETVVISADDLKDYFGKDYNDKNHKIYSRSAFRLFEKALSLVKNDTVILTGGGPSSGKTELVLKRIKMMGFDGVVYDSNMSSYDGVVAQKVLTDKYNKKIEVVGIIPNLNRARYFSIIRENETGRGISDMTFARGHAGFPNTVIKLIENDIIPEENIKIIDTRDTSQSIEQIILKIANNEYLESPLATFKELGYNEDTLKQLYGKQNYNLGTGERRVENTIREGSDTSPREDRTVEEQNDRRGDREDVSRIQEEVNSLESLNTFRKNTQEGTVTAEKFKQGFADFVKNKDAIKEDLSKKNKDQLLKMSLFSRSSDKKDVVIGQVMSNLNMWFALGRTVSYGIGTGGANTAVADLVEKTTQEDIDKYSSEVKESKQRRQKEIEDFKKAIKDPQTLEEFKTFIEIEGKEKLTSEQSVRYEDLIALQAKEKEAKELKEKGVIQGVKTETTLSVTESTNTKTGEPIFVVKMSDRIPKEQYIALNTSAKKLGGYYSRFSKGFLFKDKNNAESFISVGQGEKVETTRPEEMKAEKEQNTATKLRDMAEKLEVTAEEKLTRDRKVNTARRANMANGIEADARKEIALAKTMRNLANAIASGDAKLLNNLSTKTQIVELDRILSGANYKQTREGAKETGTFKTDVPIDNKTVEYVTEFIPQFWIKGLEETAEKASTKKGMMRASKNILNFVRMSKAGGKESAIPNKFVMEDIITISDGLVKEDVNWQMRDAVDNFKRLKSIGIESIEQLRATLREYIQFKETPASADKVTQLEREVIGKGKSVGIDFFPTPTDVADQMVDIADIEDGMTVLEPSAGNGNIADAIRKIGISPDVAEISDTLRNILEAKGYNVVAHDFLKIKDKYDRIIMNPPFMAGMDAVHLKHAYELLNSGGKVVSIVGEGSFTRNDKSSVDFREWLDEVGATVEELPVGTFTDTKLLNTTGANARLVVIEKENPKYKLQNLTLKTLDRLGDRKTVSRQFIDDLTRKTDITAPEKALILEVLETEGDTVVVSDFKNKVTTELLPLERNSSDNFRVKIKELEKKINAKGYSVDEDLDGSVFLTDKDGEYAEYDELPADVQKMLDRYGRLAEEGMGKPKQVGFERISLPSDLKGEVADYSEIIYESPVKTSAGDVHFPARKAIGYFGHTRIEDMADNKTRRVIEVQSDLYQKGNLERELSVENSVTGGKIDMAKLKENYPKKYAEIQSKQKLQQYNDPTAHFRMVREEIKKASQDGKTKLQFPTGETAMKIEGLGGQANEGNWRIAPYDPDPLARSQPRNIEISDLEVGKTIYQINDAWIITEVLGDGKFKAVPKQKWDDMDAGVFLYSGEEKRLNELWGKNQSTLTQAEKAERDALFAKADQLKESFQFNREIPDTEQFDISGKVDTNNPIYRFYEKTLSKYLKRFGAERVTDENGVEWFEVPITEQQGNDPVEAFKIGSIENLVFDRSIEEIKTGLKKIFGKDIQVKEIFDQNSMANPGALGEATKRMVRLLERNGGFSEAIASHEGWHWYKMQLSFSERAEIEAIEMEYAKQNEEKFNKLKKLYKDIPGYDSDSSIAEELMADTLAEYVKTGKTFIQKTEAWFDKAILKLKLIFSGRKDVLDMFKNIKKTLENTSGNRTMTDILKYNLNNPPEFNTGDKAEDAKLALEFNENRIDMKPIARKVPISGLKIELPEDLQRDAQWIEIESDRISQSPLNKLWKYANKKEGILPESGVSDGSYWKNGVHYNRDGSRVTQWQTKADEIVDSEEFFMFMEDGHVTVERVREEFEKFIGDKRQLKKFTDEYKEKVKAYKLEKKDEAGLQKISEMEDKRTIAEIKAREEEARKDRVRIAEQKGSALALQEQIKKEQKKEVITKAKSTPIRELSTWQRLVSQKLNPLKFTDKITQNIFNAWNSKIKQGIVRANKEAESFKKIPADKGMETILAYEAGKSTEYSKEIKDTFDALLEEARTRGVDMGFRENYLPHVYAESTKEIKEKIHKYLQDKGLSEDQIVAYENGEKLPESISNMLKINPFFSKERVFPTYEIAMQYGLTPKYKHIAQLVGHYVEELETIIANNELVTELEGAGKILPFDTAPVLSWQMVNLPFQQKGYMAPPNIAKVINGLFGDQEPTAWTYFAKLSKKMQEIRLSAGVPYTTVNFFAIGQLIKELTSGNVKALNSFFRANFNRQSVEWFKDNREYMYMMAKQGIDLGKTMDSFENLYNTLKDTDGLLGKSQEIFDQMFSKKTFMSFLPMVQIQLFKDTYTKMIEQGYPTDVAEEFAGRIISNNFGLTDFSGRSKLTQDKLSSLFFAPKFREGIINTLSKTGEAGIDFAKNLGGLKSPLDPTLVQNRKLLLGMIITYALYNLLNASLNDDDDDENGKEYMWDNPRNRKSALQIPTDDGTLIYVEFMPSFLAFARNMASGAINLATGDVKGAQQKFGSIFSMPIKITSEILGNADYFDRPIYKDTDTGGQKALKIAQYLGLQVNHPYVTELVYQIQDKKPLYQSVIAGMELPLKFSTKDKVAQGEYYDALDRKTKENARVKDKVQPIYEDIQKMKTDGKIKKETELFNALTEDEKIVYNKIKQNPYEKKVQKNNLYEDGIDAVKTKSLAQVQKEIAVKLYGPNPKPAQISTVAKDFGYYREFNDSKLKKYADEYKGMTSNENKILYLQSLKKKLSTTEYQEFITKGRKSVRLSSGGLTPVLISDEVIKKAR